ncbi:MAG: hypothetical protein LBT44_06790 [Clostridiales bacterium]|jgi:hypothetical protein|nr:hypothetical protein [Clostridiales bacterium]
MKKFLLFLCIIAILFVPLYGCNNEELLPEETSTVQSQSQTPKTTATVTETKPSEVTTEKVLPNFNISDFELDMPLKKWLEIVNWDDFIYLFEPYAHDGQTTNLALAQGRSILQSTPKGLGFVFDEDEKLEIINAYTVNISTKEGIKVGDMREQVLEIYAEPLSTDEGFNRCDYKIDNGYLIIEFQQNKVYKWQICKISLAEIIKNEKAYI